MIYISPETIWKNMLCFTNKAFLSERVAMDCNRLLLFVNSRKSLFRSDLCGHVGWQRHLLPISTWHHTSQNSNNPEAAQRSHWTIVRQAAKQLITAGMVWCINEINFPSDYLGMYQATELQRGAPSINKQGGRTVGTLINCTYVWGI